MRVALSCALVVVLSGCQDARQSGGAFRDSAGITIVESTDSAWARDNRWSVDTLPLVDLTRTGDDAKHEFFNATDAARLSDGSIIVADDGTDEIRIFSADGAYLRTVGRKGDGPGEFQRLDQVFALPGDSILAYDYWVGRLTVFSPEGRVARVNALTGAYRPRPIVMLDSGGFVGRSTDLTSYTDRPGIHRMRSPIVRIDTNGKTLDTLVTIPGSESVVITQGEARAMWARNSYLANHGSRIYMGSADSMQYEVWSGEGKLERIARIPGYDLALSGAEIEAERKAYVPDPSRMNPMVREALQLQEDRRYRPAYSNLVADVGGNVWLEAFRGRHEETEPGRWLVFDDEGRWRGSLSVPPRFRIYRIGQDWILGSRRDDLDVQHIQLLRLRRH
jgi:hypothetical protein